LVLFPYLSHESPLSLPPENWFRRVSWRWPWTGRGRWSGPSKPSNRLDQVSCRELCNLKNTKKLSMGYSDTNMMASATDIMATSASANVAADDFFSWWTMAANWLNEKHCCQFTKLGKSLIGKTWQNLTTAWSENAGPNNSASKFEQPTDFEIQLSQAYKKPKWSPTLFYCFLNVLLWKSSIWNWQNLLASIFSISNFIPFSNRNVCKFILQFLLSNIQGMPLYVITVKLIWL